MTKIYGTNLLSDVKLSYIDKFLCGLNILDVGAGKCLYSQWLADKNKKLNIFAIDKIDLDFQNSKFRYYKMDLENSIDLAGGSFDTILMFDIIEHINNEERLLEEIFRICKPGGILMGSVPQYDDKFLPNYNLTFYNRSDLTHKRYYSIEQLKNLFIKTKFTPIDITPQGCVSPHVIAEFFPCKLKYVVKKIVGLLRRVGIINNGNLASELFFAAKKN